MKLLLLMVIAICCTACEFAVRNAMQERLPHQLANVFQVETFKQRFDGTEEERGNTLNWLIGEEANSALARTWTEHFFRCIARKGDIEVQGTLVVSFIVDPMTNERYAIEGWGYFDSVTTKDVTLLACVNSMPELVERMQAAVFAEAEKVKALSLALENTNRANAADRIMKTIGSLQGQTLVDTFVFWVPEVLWKGQDKVPAGALVASGRFRIDSRGDSSLASAVHGRDPVFDVPVFVSTTRRFAAEYLQWHHEHRLTYNIHMTSGTDPGVLSINYAVGHEVRRPSTVAGKTDEVVGHLYFDPGHPSWKIMDLRDTNMLRRYTPSGK